jgi:glycerol-3-phosphate acyltransferase PlsX
VDVVVTDGFTGNIVLKVAEGLAEAIGGLLKQELAANPVRQVGKVLAAGALLALKRRMSREAHGGAPLLGLSGNVIKVHGSARRGAVKNAVLQASRTVSQQLNATFEKELARFGQRLVPS